jgi:hypothetical protein
MMVLTFSNFSPTRWRMKGCVGIIEHLRFTRGFPGLMMDRVERRSANLPPTSRPRGGNDPGQRAEEGDPLPSVATLPRMSRESADGAEGLPTTGGRATGGKPAGTACSSMPERGNCCCAERIKSAGEWPECSAIPNERPVFQWGPALDESAGKNGKASPDSSEEER